MAEPTDAQFDAAEARGLSLMASEPRAETARYDAQTGKVMLDLVNGCSYTFPASLVEDLHASSPADLASVEVDGKGFNLHWPALDVDLMCPRSWLAFLARVAG